VTKCRNRFPGVGIERNQTTVAGTEDNSRRYLRVAGPVGHTSMFSWALDLWIEAPDLLAALGFQRDDSAGLGREVHAAADYDRRGFELPAGFAGMEGPGPVQRCYIRRRNLMQRRITHPTRIVSVSRPVVLCCMAG